MDYFGTVTMIMEMLLTNMFTAIAKRMTPKPMSRVYPILFQR